MSTGPSGANSEYLFMLEDSLLGLGEESGDEHVRDLAERVRLLKTGGKGKGVRSGKRSGSYKEVNIQSVENEVERMRSNRGEQADEETEKVSQLKK